jgi:hypothetical protein
MEGPHINEAEALLYSEPEQTIGYSSFNNNNILSNFENPSNLAGSSSFLKNNRKEVDIFMESQWYFL